MRWAVPRWAAFFPSLLWQSRYAFELLLDRLFWVFAVADAVVILRLLLAALLGAGSLEELYMSTAVWPLVLLGVPVLAGTVALERRAGSLDLALAVPSTELYFVRRVAPVCVFLVVQGWLLTLVAFAIVLEDRFFGFVLSARGLALLPTTLHTAVVGALVGAVTLFWASRLASAGGVTVASFATVFAFSKWVFADPIIRETGPPGDWWLGLVPVPVLVVSWNLTVVVLAAVLFYLYARERLRCPEAMLA